MTQRFNIITDKLLNEARALELTPEENAQVLKALDEYKEVKTWMDEVGINNPKKISKSQIGELSQYKINNKPIVYKEVKVGPDKYHGVQLSNIKFKDRKKKEGYQNTNALVFVNFDDPLEDLSAIIYEVDKVAGVNQPVIVINNDYVGGKMKDLYALISHELLHGVQKYKEKTDEYEQAIEDIRNNLEWDRVDYYTDPGELEVQIGEVVGNVRHFLENEYRKYQQINKTEGYPEKGWAARRNLILDELKAFFSSPPENYFEYKNLKIPQYLKRSEEFLETIVGLYGASKETEKGFEKKEWESPWRRLQRALHSVYEELQKQYPVK